MAKTATKAGRQEAIERLREWLKPGDTVYTQLKSVSRSGMSRTIQLLKLEDNQPTYLGWNVAKAIDASYDQNREGVRIGGCGMDMGFALVYDLSHVLFGHGYKCLGADRCPSSYHVNHRDMLHCHGADVPCFPDDDGVYHLRTGVGREFGLGEVCPTCKGKGRYPNPDGAERFDLTHTDGYALKHRWL